MRIERFGTTYSTEPRYNTKVVTHETGVPADTFRAWERRYGVPMPHRTGSGQRLYSDRDIAIVRWLRDRTGEGLTISQAIRLLQEESTQVEPELEPAAWDRLEQQLTQALLRLDLTAADAALGHAFARYSLDDVCQNLIEPTLVAIGNGWHQGDVSIGQEHFATQYLRRKLQSLFNVYDVVAGHATVITACAPGEQHDVGLLMLALALVRRGYRVIFLGADVPLEGLLPVVEQSHADAVCLSTATESTAIGIEPLVRGLQQLARPPVVLVGGQGSASLDGSDLFARAGGSSLDAIERLGALLASRHDAQDGHS